MSQHFCSLGYLCIIAEVTVVELMAATSLCGSALSRRIHKNLARRIGAWPWLIRLLVPTSFASCNLTPMRVLIFYLLLSSSYHCLLIPTPVPLFHHRPLGFISGLVYFDIFLNFNEQLFRLCGLGGQFIPSGDLMDYRRKICSYPSP